MSDHDNPFSDPSIQEVMKGAKSGSDDYNPFADTTVSGKTSRVAFQDAPTLPQSFLPDTPVVPTNPIRQHIESLERGQAELNKIDLSGDISSPHSTGRRLHNFPPLPSFCPLKPCFHQDIQSDIPIAFQRWTTNAFYLWLGLQATIVLNFVAAFMCLIAEPSSFATFIVAIVWLFSIGPLSYLIWFRPLYKAFRDDSSMNFMIFFFTFFIHTIFAFLMTIGSFPTGFCGILTMIHMLSASGAMSKFAGFLCLLTSVCLGLIALFSIVLLVKVHSLYRTTNASLSRAHQEMTSTVMSNPQAQHMAANVISSSFSSTLR